MSIPFPPPFSRCPFPSHQRALSLSPSFSLSPPLPRSILLATLLDISGAHACNEIRMPRALAEPGHTPIERMNCGPSRKPSENRPRCCPPSANLSNPPPPLTTRPFRIAARKGSGGYSQPVKVSALFCQPSIFFSRSPVVDGYPLLDIR